MSRPNVWLSIDWDFFVREDHKWDWGHGESEVFQSFAWEIRVANFLAAGKDLPKEMSLRHAKPSPGSFWRKLLELGYRFDNVKAFVVADSHKWAYWIFDRANGSGPPVSKTRLVHFDAHHDLVYSIKSFSKNKQAGIAACDDWHLMTLLKNLKLKSFVVYPPWKGLHDWEKTIGRWENHRMPEARELHRLITKWVDFGVWGDSRIADAAGQVEVVYLCRSGGWTPPWHDLAFRKFAQEGARLANILPNTMFVTDEKLDPFVSRKLDWTVIRSEPFRNAKIVAQLQAEMEGKTPLNLLA